MPATVIVGAQWGDEGKGKIVDLLAQRADLVCRYQGGPNAGHTIVVDGETYKIRQIPRVISGKPCVLGAGCVIDPAVLIEELDDLERRGISTDEVHVSGNAHLIMPWHVAIDQASERRLGHLQIGTTRRGIGPAYADKASRLGIRVQDLFDAKILRQKIEVALAEKNVWLERVYEAEPLDARGRGRALRGLCPAAAPAHRRHVAARRPRAARRQARALRGRAGDAARPRPRHVSVRHLVEPGRGRGGHGIGIGPNRLDSVLGVPKAYVTRVGEGPFPSEIEGPDQARVRELGGEFGTVTGRERRCGWLDLVGLRYAARLNGFTSLAMTKLDVLSTSPSCRSACATGSATAPRRTSSRPTRATSTTAGRCTRCCPDGRSRSTPSSSSPTCRPPAAATSSSSSASSASRSPGRHRREARARARPRGDEAASADPVALCR